ncbi:MAG: class I SAM-dependent methyltransferase [Pirellulales bacterium]|jgi:ubiquinone/menaquinone biosynthesis methyltransferase
MQPQKQLFEPKFVCELFTQMSKTYGLVNLVSSFGFSHLWRKQCVKLAQIESGMTVYDLMTGMGECWHLINRRLTNEGNLIALDFCPEMCRQAEVKQAGMPQLSTQVLQEDFLNNSLPAGSADRVVSSFGLKTFSPAQKEIAAQQVQRILKPGGLFSLIEISVPQNPLLKVFYMFYLNHVIPLIGKLFLGDPNNYKLLGTYTQHFQNAQTMGQHLEAAGLIVQYQSHFFGCATSLVGKKPAR